MDRGIAGPVKSMGLRNARIHLVHFRTSLNGHLDPRVYGPSSWLSLVIFPARGDLRTAKCFFVDMLG